MKTYDISVIPKFIPRQRPIKKTNEKLVFNKSRKIVHLVCCQVGMTYNELTEKERSKGEVSLNKQIAAYLAVKETGIGWSAMGRILQDNHAAVYHAYNNIEFKYGRYKNVRERVDMLKNTITHQL